MTTWTKTRPTIPGVYIYRQKWNGRWTELMRMTISSNGTCLCDDFAVLNPEDEEWWVEDAPAWSKTPPSEPGWYWVRNVIEQCSEPEPWWFDGEEWKNVCGNDFPCANAPRGCEWWPVRIEPPKEQA